MQGGVKTQEIEQLIKEVETEIAGLDYRDFDCGKREGLQFTLEKLKSLIYE